jgi:hypothetical protein
MPNKYSISREFLASVMKEMDTNSRFRSCFMEAAEVGIKIVLMTLAVKDISDDQALQGAEVLAEKIVNNPYTLVTTRGRQLAEFVMSDSKTSLSSEEIKAELAHLAENSPHLVSLLPN